MAIDYASDEGRVRLLVCDVDETRQVFTPDQIAAFLALEDGNVKRAAAQAIDTNADNEVLASKVLHSQDVSTDGSKIAAAMHARADSLRAQADADEAADGYFDIVEPQAFTPELSGW